MSNTHSSEHVKFRSWTLCVYSNESPKTLHLCNNIVTKVYEYFRNVISAILLMSLCDNMYIVGVRLAMSLQRMTSLSKALSGLMRPYRATAAVGSKSYFTYVNEPSMPIPDKEPCWVKSAEEAVEAAGLASSKLNPFFFRQSNQVWKIINK